jgi:5-methylcytosine-specific restriction endonuclease McrA
MASPRRTFRSNKNRRQAIRREQWVCQYCGSSDDLTTDHIRPLAKGGTNDRWNLQTLCAFCNNLKGDQYPFRPPSRSEIESLKDN